MCPLDIHLHRPHQVFFVCWQMSTLKLHTFRPCPMPCLKQFERTSLHTREGQSFKGQVAWQVPTLFPGSLQCKEPHLAATDFDMPKCKDVRPARYLAIWRQSRHPLQGNAMTNSWIWAAKGGVKKRNRFLSFTRFTLLGISVSSVA